MSARIMAGLAAGMLAAAGGLCAVPQKVSGSIAGVVRDVRGVPQRGATVSLYNRLDRLTQQVVTGEKGVFAFAGLVPDVYSVRVRLANFLPAVKRNILVQPGMQSLLNVSLTSLFSSIQLVSISPGPHPLMSDDWKWVLRSASATRPVLRLRPDVDFSEPVRRASSASVFSDTRGLVRISAGDQGRISFLGNEPDLGTAFALATSVYGHDQIALSGNLGYSPLSGAPSAGFQTSYRRQSPSGLAPEVRVTMRQLFLPVRAGAAVASGQQQAAPALRTLSAALLERAQLSDDLQLEYGFSLESVTFLERLNYLSPYARLSYRRPETGEVQLSYASGAPPSELYTSGADSELEMQQDLAALARFPRVSLRAGTARVQRFESLEAGYRKRVGSRTYSAAAYRDRVNNVALTLASPAGLEAGPDLLPEMFSDSWVLNAGRYGSLGYLASVSQHLGEHLEMTMAFGSGGALTVGPDAPAAGSPEELRQLIRHSRRHALTARVSGVAPATGTQFATSYQWAKVRALTPAHMFLTQKVREGVGLNVVIRQPLPYFGGLPGRLEATADLRNLLAQGYVPLNLQNRRVYLMHTPRSLRGGLSFIF